MFQVIQPERALYIQANNCVEARDWIDILTKVSQCNRKRLSTYHPSAYLNGHWLCCKLSADTAPGCTPCTGYVSGGRILSNHMCLPFTQALSLFHLFPVVCRQTSSWTWMETERLRGFIPCSAHTCPKSSRCKVRPRQECLLLIHSLLCSFTTVHHHSHSAARLFPQRPVAVSLCTTGQSRRSTPASSSMTPRRLTKPLNRSFQPCRPWSSSTPSTSATSSRRQR